MSSEIAPRAEGEIAVPPAAADSPIGAWAGELVAWADAAQKAHQIATVLCETSFVPKSMHRRPGEVTGAILTGMELHVPIMWALGNIDIVEGRPGVSAKGQRALLKRAGHEIWTEESTATRAVVCARHKGEQRIEKSVWTLDRAKRANLLGKTNWRLYSQDMLLNRATAEAARLAVPDIALGMYTLDELNAGDDAVEPGAAATPDGAAPEKKRRTAQRKTTPPPGPDLQALPSDIPAPPPEGTRPAVVSEAQAVATMEAAGFEVVDVIDTMEEPPPPTTEQSFADSCDMTMPHDMSKHVPDGCPPNCPTRIEVEESMQAEYEAEEAAEHVEMMTGAQRKRMAVEMRRVGLVERDDRLAFAARVVGHDIETSNELTVEEASQVITALVEEGLNAVETRYDQDGGE
jgi:hypothetical protein